MFDVRKTSGTRAPRRARRFEVAAATYRFVANQAAKQKFSHARSRSPVRASGGEDRAFHVRARIFTFAVAALRVAAGDCEYSGQWSGLCNDDRAFQLHIDDGEKRRWRKRAAAAKK